MKEAVVTIRRKYSDQFEGQSKGYTLQLNLDCKFFKGKFSTLEPDLIHNYEKLYENDIEDLDMEPYKTFFVPFDSTKLNLFNTNDPVKNKASSSDKKKSKGERCGTNLW